MLNSDRRQFLGAAAIGTGLVGTAGLSQLLSISPLTMQDATVTEDLVRFSADTEPIVALIEKTPRENVFDVLIDKLKSGLPYRRLMAGLFLAGIRNIDSAHVGGNLHSVFVVHSAHQLGLDSALDQRLLPMFWAVDYFKKVQNSRRQKHLMAAAPKISDSVLKNEKVARQTLESGLESFDTDKIEIGLIAFARNESLSEIADVLWRYSARDFRPIGHKAIYMANAWRTLQTIGWRHAEPVMRSLARSLGTYGHQRTGSFQLHTQSYGPNWDRVARNVKRLPGDWAAKQSDKEFVKQLLGVMRTGKHGEACDLVMGNLAEGKIKAQSVWDAVHLAAAEIVLRQRHIRAMHGITSANALHYAFSQAKQTETRLLMLLQAVGWVCHFVPFLVGRQGKLDSFSIETIEVADLPVKLKGFPDKIFDQIGKDKTKAASLMLAYASRYSDWTAWMKMARQLVYAKATESHRYKFAAAIFEDIYLISPEWRPLMLAASTNYFSGSSQPNSKVMSDAVSAIKRLR